ncbi:NUDIX domain-containing protein [Metamycoplasma hominis]|uniref:NUDIX domain-containing protein n=1 Tax=Metamycoplasma hominis TaxID=2098 RepID=UPI00397B29D8
MWLWFPGGHLELKESFVDSVIREIKEETELDIFNLELCGVKQWFNEKKGRNVCFLYKTNNYTGELNSTDEGKNFG